MFLRTCLATAFCFLAAALAGAQEAARRDRLGDPLPAGAVLRLGSVRLRQPTTVNCLAFTADGKQLVSSGYGNKLHFWDTATGKMAKEWTLAGSGVAAIHFSADGKLAVVADSSGTARILDGKTGAEKRRMQDPMRRYGNLFVQLSPDGKWLVMVHRYDRQLLLWDVESGVLKHRVTGASSSYTPAFAFTPDSKQMVTLWTDNRLHLVDLATGKSVRTLEPAVPAGSGTSSSARVPCLALTPDGKRVVYRVNSERRFLIGDVATGKVVKQWENTSGPYSSTGTMAVTPNGRFLIESGGDAGIRVWGLTSGKLLRDLRSPSGSVSMLATAPDGKHVASSSGGAIFLWDVTEGEMLHEAQGHVSAVGRLAFTPDGKKIVSVGNLSVRIWDAADGKLLHAARQGGYNAGTLSASADGKTLRWVGADRAVWRWRPGEERDPVRLTNPRTTNYYASQAVSADGKWLAGIDNRDRKLRIIDLLGGAPARDLLVLPNAYSNYLTFSPDGRFLALASSDRSVSVYDVASGIELRKLVPEGTPGYSGTSAVHFSPDGRSFLLFDGELRVVETVSGGERLRLPKAAFTAANQMAWSEDGRLVARALPDGAVVAYDVLSGRELLRREGTQGGITSLAFSRDGRRLASGGSDTTVLVWDVPPAGKPERTAGRSDEAAWKDLASLEAAKAFRSMTHLMAGPDGAVKLIKERLKPPPPVDEKLVRKLIAELDSDTFAVRELAAERLAAMGRAAEKELEGALKHKSLEVRRTAEGLLNKVRGGSGVAPDRLRAQRAVEVLERIGTPAAAEVLKGLLKAKVDVMLEGSVKAALARMGKTE